MQDELNKFYGLDAEAITSLVRREVTVTVQELLGVDTADENGVFDPTEPLMEAGLDSLAATQLVRSLSELLEEELSPTVLYDHPTVDALVAHIVERASGVDKAMDAVPGTEMSEPESSIMGGETSLPSRTLSDEEFREVNERMVFLGPQSGGDSNSCSNSNI